MMKVIYFDIDTLRVDHLSCYGSVRNTPYIDALAKDSVRFSQAYASNTPCMPARAAVFTGCFGITNGVETHGPLALSVSTPSETALPRILTWQGVEAVTVSSFGRHPAPWFYNGFSHVIDPSYRYRAENFQRFDGRAVNEAAMEFLDGFQGNDLFLHLHYWDPHGPLTPPPDWIDWEYEPDTSRITDEQMEQLIASPLYRGGKHMNIKSRNDLAELFRLYDAEVRYTDYLIGQICTYLKARKWYEDSVILLSADHGEQYGEWQMILEHGTVHESCIHIPLLLKLPHGIRANTSCPYPVYGLDIAPTIAKLFHASVPENWDGISLIDFLDGTAVSRRYLICEHGLYTCQRAILQGRWKLVHTFSPGLWTFSEYALYDRQEDPAEMADVKEVYPEVVRELQNIEEEWLKSILQGRPDILKQMGTMNKQYGMGVAQEETKRLQESFCILNDAKFPERESPPSPFQPGPL